MMGAMEPRTCAVDRHPLKDKITAMIADGQGYATIERAMREKGHPIKRETVKAHVELCLGNDASHAKTIQKIVAAAERGEITRKQAETDFAVAVQKQALHELGEGHLRVTTKDGLVAQQLLDKRAEKERDRAFVMDLARLISGAGAPPPPEIIDGEFTELGDDVAGLLAPPELRDDG